MCLFSVVGGTVPADAYEVALLNGCDLQDASQFVQVSQQQQLAVLYNNNVLPISQYIKQFAFSCHCSSLASVCITLFASRRSVWVLIDQIPVL